MGVNLKGFKKKLSDDLKKGLKILTGSKFGNQIGENAVKLIRVRTKLGKGVDRNGGSAKKFIGYTPGYIEQRKRFKKQGKLAGTPKKANLVQTGEMLDKSLSHIFINNKIIIGMGDDKNAKKAAFVSTKRPFLNLSKAEISKLTKVVRKRAEAIFSNLFRK